MKRQCCGQLGRTANCRASVFLAYASVCGCALLDRRLYLPEDWFSEEYAERRLACGVHADTTFMTKLQLGLEMIQSVGKAASLPCRWVAGDEAFGDNPALLDAIADVGKWYFMEVSHDTRVWRERPATAPRPWSGRGRTPSKLRLGDGTQASLTVAALAAELPPAAWQRVTIQEGSQGPQVAAFAFQRVVAVRDGLPGPEVWLVVRRSLTEGALKTYLSNAPADIATTRLVRTSGMRWPIGTCGWQARTGDG